MSSAMKMGKMILVAEIPCNTSSAVKIASEWRYAFWCTQLLSHALTCSHMLSHAKFPDFKSKNSEPSLKIPLLPSSSSAIVFMYSLFAITYLPEQSNFIVQN